MREEDGEGEAGSLFSSSLFSLSVCLMLTDPDFSLMKFLITGSQAISLTILICRLANIIGQYWPIADVSTNMFSDMCQ